MSISIAIITKNEEERLPDCLRSVSFADEIIVVDSCSNDNTVAIARSFGARVFIEPWRGFSAQKQSAVDHCTNKWVLVLDADERVPLETVSCIQEMTRAPDKDIGAYSLKRKNYLHGRWIKSCGWWPNCVVRLVDKNKGAFDGKSIHESWHTTGTTIPLETSIEHISFKNYSDLIKKMDHYSNLGSAVLKNKTNSANPLKAVARGCWMFFKTYFLELGFWDGFDGFVISITNAGGSFFKYAKHRELAKHQHGNVLPNSDKRDKCLDSNSPRQ
jgi:glycosyltransferase involved in cell wall biosynthesis